MTDEEQHLIRPGQLFYTPKGRYLIITKIVSDGYYWTPIQSSGEILHFSIFTRGAPIHFVGSRHFRQYDPGHPRTWTRVA